MMALPIARGVVMLSLAIVAGAVFGLGDDQILAQPPERVAQEFVRAIGDGQVESARSMLSRAAERRASREEMRRIADDFRARIGRLEDVEIEVVDRSGVTAAVRIRIEGERANAEPLIALVRESGSWSVAGPGDILAIDDSAAGKGRR